MARLEVGLGVGLLLRSVDDIESDLPRPNNRDEAVDPLEGLTHASALEPIFPFGLEVAFAVLRPLWLGLRADLVAAPLSWSVTPEWSRASVWLELAAGLRVAI